MPVGRLPIGFLSGLAIFTVILLGSIAWADPRENIWRAGKEGFFPEASLISDPAGNLYGTTEKGGVFHGGTVFELTPNADGTWTETVLHNFCSLNNCQDGRYPLAAVTFDEAGNLYGTTSQGGAHNYSGTVFKLTPNKDGTWTESVLHNFCSRKNCFDGGEPAASLIFDEAGNLYGTTEMDGAHCTGRYACGGVVFELTPNSDGSWMESVLYNFCSLKGCFDGRNPASSLIFDKVGNLYGTTAFGGVSNYFGTVFELSAKAGGGWTEKVLHRFSSDNTGYSPVAGLIFDTAGNLYGTASDEGGGAGGTVFELTPKAGKWTEKILYRSGVKGGAGLRASLIFDKAGNLYSTASDEGLYGHYGTVFELTPKTGGGWAAKVLHTFIGKDGSYPAANLIFDATGNLFGTTVEGGTHGHGTVFELSPRVNGGWREKVLHNFGPY
jgi:uncharacterized repeat protein (TIGR03803 family)